jgi:putative (di)nucleoside polyphosphate hydrolase
MDHLYRAGVGIMLLNRDNMVFVAQRLDNIGAWQMPQGGIDKGENPRDALWRELMEEVGTGKAEILDESPDWYSYDLPADLQARLWGGKYKGQRQKWFVLRFTGVDADINIRAHHPPEFSEWKWASHLELPDMIVPFKRDLYRRLLLDFKKYF